MPKKVQSRITNLSWSKNRKSCLSSVHPYAINYQNSVNRQKSCPKLQYISAPKFDINMQW